MNGVLPLGKKVIATPLTLGFGFTLCVAWGLRNGWKLTFGAVFEWLAEKSVARWHPFRFLHTISTSIVNALAKMEGWAELHFVKMLVYIGEYLAVMAGTVYLLGWAFYKAQKAAWAAIDKLGAAAASKVSTAVVTLIRKIVGAAIAVERKVWQRSLGRVDARARHAEAVADNALEFPRPRFGRLEKTKVSHRDLTKWLRRTLFGTLGVSVVLYALKRLGLRWVTCRQVGRVGKTICGMNPRLLESLLLDAAVLTVAFDLEEFAKEMQTITGEAARLIHNWSS